MSGTNEFKSLADYYEAKLQETGLVLYELREYKLKSFLYISRYQKTLYLAW